MRKALIWLCALLLAALPARALVIEPKPDEGLPQRLEQARREARNRQVGHYGMIPIAASQVPEGVYPVAVESNSPFFKIVRAEARAEGAAMTLEFVIGSESYDRVYAGYAADATDGGWIDGVAVEGGTSFMVPLPALNAPFACAAHSVSRDRWYDRQLMVDAASLPEGVLGFDLPDYELIEKALKAYDPPGAGGASEATAQPEPEAAAVNLPDGEYAIEVNLAGGSGRASVSSPTHLLVRQGRAYARLLWSSAYYDYMLMDGARYENLSADGGNSTFEIPIPAMDAPVTVIADTTAMGDPVEIEYQLTFYAESVGDVGQVPQEAAKQVLIISLVIILAGGALNWWVKRRRKSA